MSRGSPFICSKLLITIQNNKTAIFHYYDYLANTWQTSTFADDAFSKLDSPLSYGEVVSDGKAIYLFCTNDESNKTKLTIIKLTL